MISLSNTELQVKVHPLGAELKSIRQGNVEHLWQGDSSIWPRSAPILFPVVGKSFNNEVWADGKAYPLSQHGFARDMVFEVDEQSETKVVFSLKSNSETLAKYPYHFELRLSYTLVGNAVECGYEVHNTGKGVMYFSIGAHPGFNLFSPLSDHFIEFECDEQAPRYLLTDGLLNGETLPLLNTSNMLPLDPSLFHHDAIVFKHLQSKAVRLASHTSSQSIEMKWDGFPYLGIWSKKGCEDFICIEPWCGIAGSSLGQTPLETREGINSIMSDEVFRRTYTITFNL